VHAWLARPSSTVLLLLLVPVRAAFTPLVGVTVVVEDYVHAPLTKLLALIALQLVHVLVRDALYAVLRIAFGAAP